MSGIRDLPGLAVAQNAHSCQPSLIPPKGLPFRDSKTGPVKGMSF